MDSSVKVQAGCKKKVPSLAKTETRSMPSRVQQRLLQLNSVSGRDLKIFSGSLKRLCPPGTSPCSSATSTWNNVGHPEVLIQCVRHARSKRLAVRSSGPVFKSSSPMNKATRPFLTLQFLSYNKSLSTEGIKRGKTSTGVWDEVSFLPYVTHNFLNHVPNK